jgi:putative ABC transport system permease protein
MDSTFLRDLSVAKRMLAKSPSFALVAILILALGIGANCAIFTVVNSVLLTPLPYPSPDRLVLLYSAIANQRDELQPFSYPHFQQIAEQNHSFSGIAAFTSETFNLTGRGDPEQITSARVSWNFFDVLGVRPSLGRNFLQEEDRPEGNRVVLLSHEFWMRHFAGDTGAIGQSIALDSQDYTIIGVLPPGFSFSFLDPKVEIWTPKLFNLNVVTPAQVYKGVGFLTGVARLGPGVSLDRAQAEMEILKKQYQLDNPSKPDSDPKQTIVARNLQDVSVANLRSTLLTLAGAVGFVLLIACANIASLLLSRALARRKEMAIRSALGASRGTVIRQLLTESLLLASVSGFLGLLLGFAGTKTLATLGADRFFPTSLIHMDFRVLIFTLAISILSAVFFGLMPTIELSRPDIHAVLRDEGRGSTGSRRRASARNMLVVSQIALSMVLLVGAGLLIRSLVRLQLATPGFDPKDVLTMQITLPPSRYPTRPEMIAFYHQLLERTQSLPGVRAVAVSSALPLKAARITPVLVEGQPDVPLVHRPFLNIQTISPSYASVMRVPLIRGREFSDRDNAQAPPVAIVNQALVRRFWPNEDPVGKKLWIGRNPFPTEVVGVFGDIKNSGIANPAVPEVFLPFPQLPWANLNLNLRSDVEPHSLASAVRERISTIDKDQPITNVQSLSQVLDDARAQPRFAAFLLGAFSVTALVLATVGIYGVVSYSVAQRTQEIGIRLALGATTEDIVKLVIRYALGLATAGVLIGLAAAMVLSRVVSSLLYQVSASDPLTFVTSAVLFVAVAAGASYLPARRATRVDPIDALRYQ